MGMDVYGKAATTETGKYFRQSVWGWRPLWEYCQTVAPTLTNKVKYGQTNDGDGLNAEDAPALARRLRQEIESGRTLAYTIARDAMLAALPDEPCKICGATGKRAQPPHVGAGEMPCNGCKATGKVRPWETWYPLDVETISEFADFLEGCGGFEIH